MTSVFTAEDVERALSTIKEKWGLQGAAFEGKAQESEEGARTQLFTFDSMPYRLVLGADLSLSVQEPRPGGWVTVRTPPGLPFPKGLKRPEGYRD